MKRNISSTNHLRILCGCAVLTAVAVLLQYIEIAIPLMPSFIKLDFSDLPALIGAFAYGPIAGCEITILKNIIHMMVSQSGFVGELANAILGCVFSLTAGIVYKLRKGKASACIGGLLGSIIMAVVSLPTNLYLIYPMYFTILNYPQEVVLQMYQAINPNIDTLTRALLCFNVPFTLVKGLIDVLFCMLIYKRLSQILHGEEK